MADGRTARASSRSFLNASALVFAGSMIMSVGGFAFHAIASRRLGVADYGALYALLSVYSIAVLPVGFLTPVIARYAAEFRALHDDGHVRGLIDFVFRGSLLLGAAYIVLAFALAAPIGRFLAIVPWEIPILGAMSAIGVFAGTMRGIGQGLQEYSSYGLSMAGEGVAKIAAIALLALIGLNVLGSTSSFAIGMVVGAILITTAITRRYFHQRAVPIVLDARRILASTAGAAAVATAVALMGFGDVILVKHYFSASDAGLYSAASLSGKILMYFVGFIPAILIPQATDRHARGERTRITLALSLIFVAGVALVGVLAYRVAGPALLHALVGRAFDAGIPLLVPYAAAMAFLAMTNTLGSYAIATHRLAFVAPLLLATFATLGAIALNHPSLWTVAGEMMLGNLVMLLAVAAPLLAQAGKRRHS